MTDDHKKHYTFAHMAALLALPALIIVASISASNTRQDIASKNNPAAIYGITAPAAGEGTP